MGRVKTKEQAEATTKPKGRKRSVKDVDPEEEKEVSISKRTRGRSKQKANDVDFEEKVAIPKRTRGRSKQKAKDIDSEEEKVSIPKRTRGRPKQKAKDGESLVSKNKKGTVAVKREKEETDDSAHNTKGSKKGEIKKNGVERSVVKKGAAAVDGLCPTANSSHVYCDDEIWDCMLNQTNIQFNNNKYYIIQLLRDDNKEAYSVWMRWGRVGNNGQNCLKPFGANVDKAKDTFRKKFNDKTRNNWEDRECFIKVPGKYDLLHMDYSDGKDEVDKIKKEVKTETKSIKKVESKLEVKVKALIELICDVKAMEEAVVEMKYDAEKAPLGKLTSDQVKAGYAALKEIESVILSSGEPSNRDLVEVCNAFYTRIPHCFGMKVPPLIRTKTEIQEKITLLQALGDIQAAMNIINQPLDEDMHPVDQHYEGIDCDIEALNKKDSEFQLLEKYLKTTHGKTHSMYKMEVIDIFKVKKSNEESRFKNIGNRMLLWHGSRLTNWAGILSQGLRIAPPEAPSTGYMFGKGIYFADMSSKSANYCMPSYQNKTGLLVLCDVSLGKCNELLNANYQAHKLPKGCQSVKGLGEIAPDPKNFVTAYDDVTVPMGPGTSTKIDNKRGYTLQYNEYIVYDVSQVKIKYLFKVQFNFK